MSCYGLRCSVDVQHSSSYLSEPFLAFLALFNLGLGRFFGAEEPAVSGSGCGRLFEVFIQI